MEPAIVYLTLVIAVLAMWLVGDGVWDLTAVVAARRSSAWCHRITTWIIAALLGVMFIRVGAASAQTVPLRERTVVAVADSASHATHPMRTVIGSLVPASGEYTVTVGDCLWRIARTVLVERGVEPHGSAISDLWRGIYELNHDLIGDNPDLIHPGQVLQLPTR